MFTSTCVLAVMHGDLGVSGVGAEVDLECGEEAESECGEQWSLKTLVMSVLPFFVRSASDSGSASVMETGVRVADDDPELEWGFRIIVGLRQGPVSAPALD